jgi:D-inositol-3-phosphate glycosyltransferase
VVDAADMLVANTDIEAKQLIELYDADPGRVEVVHPGVDLDVFRPRDRSTVRAALGLPLDARVLMFAGRIQPLKAPDVLLRAVAVLLEQSPELRSRLVVPVVGGPSGSGLDHPDSLADLARDLGLDDVVRFVPPVGREELADWCVAADLVAVPSYNESFGLVAVEAQASGTPVVATAVGGLTTVVRDGVSGLLVEGHEPRDWAGALRRLVTDDELRARLAAGAVQQAREFSWDRTADRTLDVYEQAQSALAVAS